MAPPLHTHTSTTPIRRARYRETQVRRRGLIARLSLEDTMASKIRLLQKSTRLLLPTIARPRPPRLETTTRHLESLV